MTIDTTPMEGSAAELTWTAVLRDGREVLVRRATSADNTEVCKLFSSITMDADLQLSVQREPSLAGLYKLQGDAWETWVGELEGELVGMGNLVVRDAYVDGEIRRVGYLGDLRLAPQVRGRAVLSTIYGPVLDSFADRHGVEVFLTAVIASNERAVKALTGPKAAELGIPEYHLIKHFNIRAIHLLMPKKRKRGVIDVSAGRDVDIAGIAAFLDADARQRLWGMPMSEARLREVLELWPGLSIEDFLVARNHAGEIVGTMAPWDASPVKRTHVIAYRNTMRRVRRLYDVAATIARAPRLPAPGGQLRYLYATHHAVPSNDIDVHRALLGAAYRKYRRSGNVFISCCVPEGDAVEGVSRGYVKNDLPAHIYAVVPHGRELPDAVNKADEGCTLGFEMALV